MRRILLNIVLAAMALGLLGGCGFKLRGQDHLPFNIVHLDAGGSSFMAPLLAEDLRGHGKQLAGRAKEAEVSVRLAGEEKRKDILALSGGGKVREYRIEYRLTLSATDAAGLEILAPTPLRVTRDYSYDDTQALAKESEEALLHRDMERDMLRQILQRLAYVKR